MEAKLHSIIVANTGNVFCKIAYIIELDDYRVLSVLGEELAWINSMEPQANQLENVYIIDILKEVK